MPAGLPFSMPGRGEAMEGEMQQAPQPFRQCIIIRISSDLPLKYSLS